MRCRAVTRGRCEQQRSEWDRAELTVEVVQCALDLDGEPFEWAALGRRPFARNVLQSDVQPPRKIELTAVVDGEHSPIFGEICEPDRALVGFVERCDIALRGLRNIDHRQRDARVLAFPDLRLDELIASRHGVHQVIARRGAIWRRHIQHIDGGIIDVVVDHVLDAPADCALQLLLRHVRRLHQYQLVLARTQQGDALIAPQMHALRHFRQLLLLAIQRLGAVATDVRLARATEIPVREFDFLRANGKSEPAWKLLLAADPAQHKIPQLSQVLEVNSISHCRQITFWGIGRSFQ